MSNGVLVVGALNVDLVVAADRLPGPGETVVGPRLDKFGGGKGANAAIAAARMKVPVRYCGAVGDDELGREALAELSASGVDVTDVAVLDDVATGTALIVVDAAGENQIAVAAGANAALTPAHVRLAVERAEGWAGCVLVSTEISPAAVNAAVAAASEIGLLCVLNPAPVHDEVVASARAASVLTPNSSELRDLCTALSLQFTDVGEAAATVARATGAYLVVTRGSHGALVAGPDGTVDHLPALTVSDVRDTTGAGDTFNGALAAALSSGMPVGAASTLAVRAASLSVRHVGARTGMPFVEEVNAAHV
ncbi:PfkB family carbohydrate kinase [Gordonia paraffinivorans]|uniref:PfkB family carbohydrate kinase n=1 Tax=Gordonia paraffinivorans TaxID=175628 RepID=UPI001E45F7BB|nr:PfkB family carbohydrate kinase [Gordonia paraffinivorans]MCD2147385.1 PfkB family carbohydrate kinase [Gordonia paraffinivorans]